MTNDLDSILPAPPTAMIAIANNQTKTVPIDQIVVDGPRRPVDEAKVAELMDSVSSVGFLTSITVVVRTAPDGSEYFYLVSGHHRLEAAKRLNLKTIQCTVLDRTEDLQVELAQIDENLIRHNPSPAEHARLTLRRSEIIKALAAQNATLTQVESPSKQALRRAGQKTGHDVASIRDQAKRTGESIGKVQRSKKLGILGGLLSKVGGTSLDKWPELDALTKLPEAEREDLADRAASGEKVSARTPDGGPRPARTKRSQRERALAELDAWDNKYYTLPELVGYEKHIADLQVALMNPEDRPKNYAPLPLLQEGEPAGRDDA